MTIRSALALLLITGSTAASAATFSGQVIDAGSGRPVAGAQVRLYVPAIMGFPSYIATAQAGNDGRYTASVQHSGELVLIASGPGHAARTHDGTPCNGFYECYAASTKLNVGAATTATVDFSLPAGVRIDGQLRDAVGQAPALYGRLSFSWAGTPAATHLQSLYYAGFNGAFHVENLYPGSYHLKANGWRDGTPQLQLLTYLWPDLHCNELQVGCASLTPGTLNLEPGQQLTLQLDLQRGSYLRTRVISDGSGSAVMHDAIGYAGGNSQVAIDVDVQERVYLGPLLPGPVQVVIKPYSSVDYRPVVYPDLPCKEFPCDLSGAETVEVPATAGIYDLDVVHVSPLRSVRGRVVAAGSNLPIANMRVSAGYIGSPASGLGGFRVRATARTDSNGYYQLDGMGAAPFMVRTRQSSEPWMDLAWQDTTCDSTNLFCNLETVSYPQLTLGADQHLGGIDFALQPAARIRGRIVLSPTGAAAAGYTVLAIPASNGRTIRPVFTDADGRFTLGGLDPAGYYLFTAQNPYAMLAYGYLHPQQETCLVSFTESQQDCDLSSGTLLTPPAGGLIDDLLITVPEPNLIFLDGFDYVELGRQP